MDGVLKKGLGIVLVLFLFWFLFTDPSGLAGLSKDVGTGLWDGLVQLFEAFTRFLTTIFS